MNFLRSSAFNFAGGLLPAIALFVTIPVIVHRLGADAYGALVLITSVVGYFGIIDLNVTAGSVKYVAEHRARNEHEAASRVISFGLLLYLALGLLGAAGLWLGADYLVGSVFKIDPSWRDEALTALRWSAPAFLFAQLQAYLQSVPQALHRYDISGQLDAVFGSLSPLATIAVVLAGGGLTEIVIARLALSVVHGAVLVRVLYHLIPGFRLARPDRSTTSRVSSFSAYSYLQRIASVTYLNADKLLIGAQHSMTALATYVIPYTLVSRIFALLQRLMQAIFPMASALAALDDVAELRRRYIYIARYMAYLSICACLLFALFSRELLHHWLHGGVDDRAALIVILVAYSLLAESLTNVPSLVNDGLGRPKITGIASLLRVALGVGAAWWALSVSGIVAMAASQLVVSFVLSLGFLVYVHRRSLPWSLSEVARPVYGVNVVALGLGSIAVAWRFGSPVLEWWPFVGALLAVLAVFAGAGWFAVLLPEHRLRLRDVATARWPSLAGN